MQDWKRANDDLRIILNGNNNGVCVWAISYIISYSWLLSSTCLKWIIGFVDKEANLASGKRNFLLWFRYLFSWDTNVSFALCFGIVAVPIETTLRHKTAFLFDAFVTEFAFDGRPSEAKHSSYSFIVQSYLVIINLTGQWISVLYNRDIIITSIFTGIVSLVTHSTLGESRILT